MTSTLQSTWREHRGTVLDRHDPFEVIECEGCGFRHAIPLPSADELREVYEHEYYAAEKPLYLEHSREDADWASLEYSGRYELYEEQLGSERRRLLDVGSGPGNFLRVGMERGWSVLGVEPSRQAAAHARGLGLEVEEAFLDETLAARLGSFDVVHMNEVLEHVPDPIAHLALCRDLVSPGGLITVSVPNDYNPFQDALRDACGFEPWWVAPPHHLNYFDFDSLARLFERVGLEVVDRQTSFPIDLFLLMGENYVGDDTLGRACHERRKRFETNLAEAGKDGLRRDLYRKLAELGLGRHVVITGRRP